MSGKTKSVENQKVALRKKGRSALTTGQSNILMIDIIDLLADGKGRRECFAKIKTFYKDTLNMDIATSTYYEVFERAKSKWLTNVNLPSLENYKKDKLAKSELLEEELKLNSSKDITDIAKATLDIWKYQDNIVGLGLETQSDSIIVSINMDKNITISALEIDDAIDITHDVIDITEDKDV